MYGLLQSERPHDKSLDKLMAALKKRHEPKRIVMVEMFYFHQQD